MPPPGNDPPPPGWPEREAVSTIKKQAPYTLRFIIQYDPNEIDFKITNASPPTCE